AVDPALDEKSIKDELLRGLHLLYPETRAARIVHDRYLLRQDCPAFRPGTFAGRPGVETGVDGVAIAGDFVALPFPSALMDPSAPHRRPRRAGLPRRQPPPPPARRRARADPDGAAAGASRTLQVAPSCVKVILICPPPRSATNDPTGRRPSRAGSRAPWRRAR